MTLRSILSFFVLGLMPVMARGQVIDNTLSYKDINGHRYVRINYENDYFAGSDRYYTQGMLVEVVMPGIREFPLSKALYEPKHGDKRYGLNIEYDVYTPTSTNESEIRYGDRPYASCAMLNTFVIATDTGKRQRFSTKLSTGIIGPATGAMDLQTEAHKMFPNNSLPMGWMNQIQNDVVLNYQINYEKQLLMVEHSLFLSANGMARVGTLSDKAGIGMTAMTGYFDSPFGNASKQRSNFQVYFYNHLQAELVGYDATLQGGVFNIKSPYSIHEKDIKRTTARNRLGIVFIIKRIHLEYFRTWQSSEYTTGLDHTWGGIQVAWAF